MSQLQYGRKNKSIMLTLYRIIIGTYNKRTNI